MSTQSCANHFDLLNNELEFYNYHNFGHKVANFHLKNYKADPRIKSLARNASIWKNKDTEKCGLVPSSQKQKYPWYIDNGCSKHMTSDKDKFLSMS
jgi:TnpA family transposase